MTACLPVPLGRVAVAGLGAGLNGGTGATGCMTVVLGSCVAVCLWDPVARVGGMNHFILPGTPPCRPPPALADGVWVKGSPAYADAACLLPTGSDFRDGRYGDDAMHLLISALSQLGARTTRLRAWACGGAVMTEARGISDQIGPANEAYCRSFIEGSGLKLAGCDFGGRVARRVCFWPATGRVVPGNEGPLRRMG